MEYAASKVLTVAVDDIAVLLLFVLGGMLLRLGRAGFTVWRLVGAKMRHPLGAMTFHRILGLRVHACHHSPARWRTMSRNVPRVVLRHCLRYPKFSCREVVHYAEMFFAMLAFEEDRPAKIRAAALGIRDFLLGRTGAPR